MTDRRPREFSGRHDGDGVRVPEGFNLRAFIAEASERSRQRRADKGTEGAA